MTDSPATAELARWSSESPETPFLFFRGPRGHLAWWSVARAAAEAVGAAAPEATPVSELEAWAEVPRDLLRRLAGTGAEAWQRSAALAAPHPGERPIWISWRPLQGGVEPALVAAALAGRWAIVRDPGDALSPDLFAWARPTLLSAPARALLELADGFERLAPRFRSAAWERRRLSRLRTVWVEESGDVAVVADRFAALGARAAVLSFPGGGW